MRKNVYLLLVLFMTFSMSCWGQNAQKMAKSFNREIDAQLDTLSILTTDTISFYHRVEMMMKNALTCDFYDSKPDNKGNVKPRYRNDNGKRLSKYIVELENAGFYFYDQRQNGVAMDYFRLYLDCAESALFQKTKFEKGQVAYYLSLLAFGTKDFTQAERYADVALKDANFARDAAEIKINCMYTHLDTHADSTKFIIALLELHDIAPSNAVYTGMLMEYFSSPGHESELAQFAIDETHKRPQNKQSWALRGEIEMKSAQWDKAILSFSRAIALDNSFVQAIYNTALCHCSKASEMQDKLQNEKGLLKAEDAEKIKTEYTYAKKCLEKTAKLDPKEEILTWRELLAQIEKVIGKDNDDEK